MDLFEEIDLEEIDEDPIVHLQKVEQSDRNHVKNAEKMGVKYIFNNEKIKHDEVILEIGCGIGYFNTLVPRRFKNRIIQTDPSEEALEEAKKRNPKGNYKKVDCCNMPEIPDASVDRVFAMNVFNYITVEQIQQALAEIKRILKPKGRTYHLLDLQPGKVCMKQFLPQIEGIPGEFAEIEAATYMYGCALLSVVDSRNQNSSSLFSSMAANKYDPGVVFFEELIKLFSGFFTIIEETTGLNQFGWQRIPILGNLIPLIVTNANLQIIKTVEETLAKYPRWPAKRLDNPDELKEKLFSSLRKVEIAGIYIIIGEKNK
ncbi:class I SAM-dependent methyltransferase [Candidatus Peregrinibacteria bacterium]|nr:class I SAM-dependent methyltransferase [Candidatus Peregrinibacteria bacterium]